MLDRARVLLSVQRALLGAIGPEMRAIDVCWSADEIRLRIVIDAHASDDYDMTELTNEIEGEIEASFLPEAHVRSEVVAIPAPAPVPLFEAHGHSCARVFARREGY